MKTIGFTAARYAVVAFLLGTAWPTTHWAVILMLFVAVINADMMKIIINGHDSLITEIKDRNRRA